MVENPLLAIGVLEPDGTGFYIVWGTVLFSFSLPGDSIPDQLGDKLQLPPYKWPSNDTEIQTKDNHRVRQWAEFSDSHKIAELSETTDIKESQTSSQSGDDIPRDKLTRGDADVAEEDFLSLMAGFKRPQSSDVLTKKKIEIGSDWNKIAKLGSEGNHPGDDLPRDELVSRDGTIPTETTEQETDRALLSGNDLPWVEWTRHKTKFPKTKDDPKSHLAKIEGMETLGAKKLSEPIDAKKATLGEEHAHDEHDCEEIDSAKEFQKNRPEDRLSRGDASILAVETENSPDPALQTAKLIGSETADAFQKEKVEVGANSKKSLEYYQIWSTQRNQSQHKSPMNGMGKSISPRKSKEWI